MYNPNEEKAAESNLKIATLTRQLLQQALKNNKDYYNKNYERISLYNRRNASDH